jgi:hypothetical protein
MASAVALAMVAWAVWMSIAYVTNRSQIDGANAQAALATRQNQPWNSACMLCLNCRKPWPVCSTVLSMVCHGTSRPD